MVKKFEWGKANKCGVIGCDKKVDWGSFFTCFACENHRNREWGLCEACQVEKTTHTVYYDINSNRKTKQAAKEVKEGIKFQKEIIEKLFLIKNISDSLRQKLNEAYQKCQEAEKNIPELERLVQEYWEKRISCSSDFVREKGGHQVNIYECNLCDNCGNEVETRQEKLKNDYQLNVLNKLIAFSPETSAQVEKEIGRDKATKIAYELTYQNEKVKEREQIQVRYFFMSKLPFFKSKKSSKQNEEKKNFFQKLKKYFQDNQIMQIVEGSGSNYIIWYANGNIEEKRSSQLAEWGNLRTYYFTTSTKVLSLHTINNVLASLEQEPRPNEEEKDAPLDENKEENPSPLSDLELELIKTYFSKNKVKKISLKNGELVITYNNYNNEIITNNQLTNNAEYQLLKDSLEKVNKNELTSQELGLSLENTSTNTDNSPSGTKYLWLVGGVGMGIIVSGILFFAFQQKKKKNN